MNIYIPKSSDLNLKTISNFEAYYVIILIYCCLCNNMPILYMKDNKFLYKEFEIILSFLFITFQR